MNNFSGRFESSTKRVRTLYSAHARLIARHTSCWPFHIRQSLIFRAENKSDAAQKMLIESRRARLASSCPFNTSIERSYRDESYKNLSGISILRRNKIDARP